MSITPEQLAELENLYNRYKDFSDRYETLNTDEIAKWLGSSGAISRALIDHAPAFIAAARSLHEQENKWRLSSVCRELKADRDQWKERAEKAEEIVKSFTKEAMSFIHKKPPAGMGPKMALHIPTGEIYNLAPPGCDFPDPPIEP